MLKQIARRTMLKYALAPVFILVAFAGFELTNSLRHSSPPVPSINVNTIEGYEQSISYWDDQIKLKGGKKAYKKFSDQYSPQPYNTQHTAAHSFGTALYARMGTDGISVCDTAFAFGCFHSFLGKAIQDKGLSSVPSLNQACFDALGPGIALSCTHGIGHGLQSYSGYTLDGLKKSLDVCSGLRNDPIGGCFGGVFMEYNMHTMESVTGEPPRKAVDGDLLFPCNKLDSKYLIACYYWQPQWWHQELMSRGKGPEKSFSLMGTLCDTQSGELQRQCFKGIGNIAAPSGNYEVTKVSSLCNSVSKDITAQTYCKATAANTFYATRDLRPKAVSLCKDLPEKLFAYCKYYADGIGAQPNSVPPPIQ